MPFQAGLSFQYSISGTMQPSLSSSDWHSCVILSDCGSFAVRLEKIRLPMESPAELTLRRRLSFRMRTLTGIEGLLSARRVDSDE